MIIDKLKAYGFLALSIFLASMLGLQTWRLHTAQLAKAKAEVTLSSERAAASANLVIAQEKVRKQETSLNTSAAETRKATNEQVLTLSTQRDGLLKRVRLAEARAANAGMSKTATAPSDGQAPSGSAGYELLGSIGEKDVEEASRADTIRLHLKACYAQYDRAQAALSQ